MAYAGAYLLLGAVLLFRWTQRPLLCAAIYTLARLVGPWMGWVEPTSFLPWGVDHYLLVFLYLWLLGRTGGVLWWLAALVGWIYLGDMTGHLYGWLRTLQRQWFLRA